MDNSSNSNRSSGVIAGDSTMGYNTNGSEVGYDYSIASSHQDDGSSGACDDHHRDMDTSNNSIDNNIHFSNAFHNSTTRIDNTINSSSSSNSSSNSRNRVNILITHIYQSLSFQRSLVLLMGFGRLFILKLIKYQEHVSEYGLHWNFFMTLFVVWSCSDLIHRVIAKRYLLTCSIIWIIIYQLLLSNTSLTDYILHAPRTNIIAMNKEGICSLMGYIPLYMIAECISSSIFFDSYVMHSCHDGSCDDIHNNNSNNINNNNNNNNNNGGGNQLSCKAKKHLHNTSSSPPSISPTSPLEDINDSFNINSNNSSISSGGISSNSSIINNSNSSSHSSSMKHNKVNARLMRRMSITTAILWTAWIISASIQPTSRRLVNATYVCLVLAISMTILSSMYLVEVYTCSFNISVLTLYFMSKHSLIVFMVANVLTGGINMSIRTIYATRIVSIIVLIAYAISIVLVAWLLEYLSIIRAAKSQL